MMKARLTLFLALAACHSSPTEPAPGAVMLPAPVTPGAIGRRGAPPPGSEVVVCFQQTRASQATGSDCRVAVTAPALQAAHVHRAARIYLGGSDYLALYLQPEAPAAPARGPKLLDDTTDLGRHVGQNDAGRHFLFVELSRP